jgi:hypothetical protein
MTHTSTRVCADHDLTADVHTGDRGVVGTLNVFGLTIEARLADGYGPTHLAQRLRVLADVLDAGYCHHARGDTDEFFGVPV